MAANIRILEGSPAGCQVVPQTQVFNITAAQILEPARLGTAAKRCWEATTAKAAPCTTEGVAQRPDSSPPDDA